MYTYKAKLIRVIDGDTIDAEIDLGFGVFVKQRIRLYGINTPDSRSKNEDEKLLGLGSKQRLTELLTSEFIVETILNKRGKFGRILGIIYSVDGETQQHTNINDKLVADGFAAPYLLK
jgi:micrococcal nuclease